MKKTKTECRTVQDLIVAWNRTLKFLAEGFQLKTKWAHGVPVEGELVHVDHSANQLLGVERLVLIRIQWLAEDHIRESQKSLELKPKKRPVRKGRGR